MQRSLDQNTLGRPCLVAKISALYYFMCVYLLLGNIQRNTKTTENINTNINHTNISLTRKCEHLSLYLLEIVHIIWFQPCGCVTKSDVTDLHDFLYTWSELYYFMLSLCMRTCICNL